MKPKKFFHCLLLAAITLLAAVTISCSRNEKKAAASGNDTDSGKCREKHSTYNIAGGGENVNLL